MLGERYIWCRNCNEVHHVNSFDKSPAFVQGPGEWREVASDDWRAFMHRHSGHRLEGLKSVGEKRIVSGKTADITRVGYIEVTNGRDFFVVRSSRKDIKDPLKFEMVRGRLRATRTVLSIQEEAIRKEMTDHFLWDPSHRPSRDKMELFIGIFKKLVSSLSPREVRIAGGSSVDGAVTYGLIDDRTAEILLEKCLPDFRPLELKGIRTFIEAHRKEDGVMALLVKHEYAIEESADVQG